MRISMISFLLLAGIQISCASTEEAKPEKGAAAPATTATKEESKTEGTELTDEAIESGTSPFKPKRKSSGLAVFLNDSDINLEIKETDDGATVLWKSDNKKKVADLQDMAKRMKSNKDRNTDKPKKLSPEQQKKVFVKLMHDADIALQVANTDSGVETKFVSNNGDKVKFIKKVATLIKKRKEAGEKTSKEAKARRGSRQRA